MVSRWTPGLAQWLASPVVYVQIGLCPAVGHLNRLKEKKKKNNVIVFNLSGPESL